MNTPAEVFMIDVYDEGSTCAVIRPAAALQTPAVLRASRPIWIKWGSGRHRRHPALLG